VQYIKTVLPDHNTMSQGVFRFLERWKLKASMPKRIPITGESLRKEIKNVSHSCFAGTFSAASLVTLCFGCRKLCIDLILAKLVATNLPMPSAKTPDRLAQIFKNQNHLLCRMWACRWCQYMSPL
jgi:hypothetical protein